ncbi:MAG: hypothetical protein LBQ74_13050, partial [Prevotella sp.]|nr:hypothetical protein [Prevotella sp.]
MSDIITNVVIEVIIGSPIDVLYQSISYTDAKASDLQSDIDDITALIPPGTTPENQLINNDMLTQTIASLSLGFFQYQESETFIVQTEADLPTGTSPIPPTEGDT